MLEKRCEMLEKCDRNPGQMLEKCDRNPGQMLEILQIFPWK